MLHRRVLLSSVLLAVSALLATVATTSPAHADEVGTVTWGTAPADDALGTNRPYFSYALAPSTGITDALAVVNRSDTPITLKVYASDAFTTSTGAIDLLAADKKPVDVGSWITVSKPTITLAPQESTVVPFTLTIPANATPGDHSGGVVTSLVTSGSSSVGLDRRFGSRVYLRVPGTLNPVLKVGDVQVHYEGTLNPLVGGAATVSYTVTNTGNTRLVAHQSVQVTGPFGLLGRTSALADLPELLPGSSLTRRVTVHGVWPLTRLRAAVQLQPLAPANDPPLNVAKARASATTWGWPLGQLLVLVLIAVLVAGYLWLRRRRQRKVDTAIADAVSKALADA